MFIFPKTSKIHTNSQINSFKDWLLANGYVRLNQMKHGGRSSSAGSSLPAYIHHLTTTDQLADLG